VSFLRLFLLVGLGVVLLSVGWSMVDRAEPQPMPSLRIEVLNGCGVDGLASRVALELEALGQEVTRVGDAPDQNHEHSLLVDRRARPMLTERLAERIGPIPVLYERLDDATVDATLVLGRDAPQLAILTSRPSVLR
jgi:LytR cell envelope-related transcriptional attenuator